MIQQITAESKPRLRFVFVFLLQFCEGRWNPVLFIKLDLAGLLAFHISFTFPARVVEVSMAWLCEVL